MINQFEDNDATGVKDFQDDESILEYYGLDDAGSAWANIGYLAIFCAIFTMLAYVGQCSVSFVKR